MLFRTHDATPFTIPGGTCGVLYPPGPKGDQSVAVVELDGVYPEKGWSVNDVCTETLYVLEGELKLTLRHSEDAGRGIPTLSEFTGSLADARDDRGDARDDRGGVRDDMEGQEYILSPGDLFMILPGNKYRLFGKGKSCVFITPSWDSSQNHIVDDT